MSLGPQEERFLMIRSANRMPTTPLGMQGSMGGGDNFPISGSPYKSTSLGRPNPHS